MDTKVIEEDSVAATSRLQVEEGLRSGDDDDDNSNKVIDPEICTDEKDEVIDQYDDDDDEVTSSISFSCNENVMSNVISNVSESDHGSTRDFVVDTNNNTVITINRPVQDIEQHSINLQSRMVDHTKILAEARLYKRNSQLWFIVASALCIILTIVIALFLYIKFANENDTIQVLDSDDNDDHPKKPAPFIKDNLLNGNLNKFIIVTQHAFIVQTNFDCSLFVDNQSNISKDDDMILTCVDGSDFRGITLINLETSSSNIDCQPSNSENQVLCNFVNTTGNQLSYVVFTCIVNSRIANQSITTIETTIPFIGSRSCQTSNPSSSLRVTATQICSSDSSSEVVQLVSSMNTNSCQTGNQTTIYIWKFCNANIIPSSCIFEQYPCKVTTVNTIKLNDDGEKCKPLKRYKSINQGLIKSKIETLFGNITPLS
jgi:hypothetical protein